MKLQELAAPSPSKQISKVFESYFGSRIRFDQLSRSQTNSMLNKVRGILGEHRQTSARHTSQTNPKYLQLVMMEQALASRLKEMAPAMPAAPGAPAAPATGAAPTAGTTTAPGAAPKDPKLAAALKKSAAGQTLTPDEQKLVAGAAMMQAESRLRRAYRYLKESEVQQAQVVLAAQDMVDKMQGMLEDVSELQFKELPALVDSIKNQVGIDQATQFNTDVTGALTALMQSLQQAKQQLDQALGVVTGQAAPGTQLDAAAQAGADMASAGAADMGAAGADMGMAGEPGAEMGDEAGAELDDLAADAGAAPSPAALGRAKR